MRIGIASHVPETVAMLRRALASRSGREIAWVVADGAAAIAKCAQDTPDLVLIDLAMSGVNGVAATRAIMAETPCAILLLTPSVQGNTAVVFEAMGYGALDAVDTPANTSANSANLAPFLQKIDMLSKLIATRRFIPASGQHGDTWVIGQRERLVAFGASAGGPAALQCVLSQLPANFPAAIVIIQHVDERFAVGMAEWLSQGSPVPVRVAKEGDRPTLGTALLAGTNDHLIFKTAGRLGYSAAPLDQMYRPSVDVFFESLSALWSGDAVGVLLTGMGRDGAKGLKALRNRGCYTIAQDEASSAVYGMPKAAATLGAAVDILPIERIASRLIYAFSH